jgi:hypothetical protein
MFGLTGFASVGGSLAVLPVVGLVDLVFAIILMVGVIMESLYLPINLDGCQAAASEESFFQAVKSLREFEESRDPEAVCRGMVETWALLIVVV